jgi:hypothetical protein
MSRELLPGKLGGHSCALASFLHGGAVPETLSLKIKRERDGESFLATVAERPVG